VRNTILNLTDFRGALNLQDWILKDWILTDQIAGVDFDGPGF